MRKKQTKAEAANALHDKGLTLLEKGDHAGAVRLFRAAARMGDYGAMHSLGYFYDVGTGGRKDRKLAMKWYMRAFRRGNAFSAINIGITYRNEEDYDRAIAWLKRAMDRGDMSASFEIAQIYMDYLYDMRKAVPYLRLAAKAKPCIAISEWEQERAQLLLDGLAWQRKYKRASR